MQNCVLTFKCDLCNPYYLLRNPYFLLCNPYYLSWHNVSMKAMQ